MPYSNTSGSPQKQMLLHHTLTDEATQTRSVCGKVLRDPAACEWDQWRPIRDIDDGAPKVLAGVIGADPLEGPPLLKRLDLKAS